MNSEFEEITVKKVLVIGEIEEVVKLDLHTDQELCPLCECGLWSEVASLVKHCLYVQVNSNGFVLTLL